MNEYLIKDEILEIKYIQGKGAWTHHLQIPNTKDLKGRWGELKVTGFIDDYSIECINMFKIGDQDRMISVSGKIRKAINKTAGDKVKVTLFWYDKSTQITQKDILETLEEAQVLDKFHELENEEQQTFLQSVLQEKNQDKQTQNIIQMIENLGKI